MPELLFSGLLRFRSLLLCGLLGLMLSACGGEMDGTKDLYGAIGFKAGSDPVVSPGDTACGKATSTGTTTGSGATSGSASTSQAPGRCFSASEAANAITSQCADCKVVLTFKGTNETTTCGSIAVTGTKLLYGVGAGPSVIAAQDDAMAACKVAEKAAAEKVADGTAETSSCVLSKTRCL